jgi:predicted dinucleotide-utilizing enzyme
MRSFTSSAGPLRVGIIGLGAIGQRVVELAHEQPDGAIEIVGALVRDPGKQRSQTSVQLVANVN